MTFDINTLTPLLARVAASGSLAPAYVITGSHPPALSLQALLFAKRLNCLSVTKDAACLTCAACKKIEKRTHPDVKHMGPEEGTIKIEPLRALQKELHLKALEGPWKIVILEEAHELTPSASNALLKILEEPPSKTVFLLTTVFYENLLETIRSRCQRVSLPLSQHAFALEPFADLHELLTLPTRTSERFELAHKIGSDETYFKQCLEILLIWYRDLLFYKEDLAPLSPLQEKRSLGETISRKFTRTHLYENLETVLNTKISLQTQVNRQLLAENLLLRLHV
ncbi:MAG: hypothetical protein HY390_00495 [Deltaproteobacteria bacterium]|nr:hypothetical protein [Deltaproteobacteria bacterium]